VAGLRCSESEPFAAEIAEVWFACCKSAAHAFRMAGEEDQVGELVLIAIVQRDGQPQGDALKAVAIALRTDCGN